MGSPCFSLLRMLADGGVHSREAVGRALGLSPTELSGLAGELETLGLHVLDDGACGYRLEERVELFDADLLTERLREVPALHLEVLDECASTNTTLAARAKAGAAHGTVLACEHQSAGRGRRGNPWISTVGGGVTFSILWRFPRSVATLAGLGLAAAVGAAKALEALGARCVAVKWPNDLLCGGRKLGGILIETTADSAGASAIVGVGVNLRLTASARQRLGMQVTDIATHCAAAPSRSEVFTGLVVSIAAALEQFSREGFAPFRQPWLARHAWQGRRVIVSQSDRSVAEGEVIGIAEDGALELACERGVQRFHSGELSLRLGQAPG